MFAYEASPGLPLRSRRLLAVLGLLRLATGDRQRTSSRAVYSTVIITSGVVLLVATGFAGLGATALRTQLGDAHDSGPNPMTAGRTP